MEEPLTSEEVAMLKEHFEENYKCLHQTEHKGVYIGGGRGDTSIDGNVIFARFKSSPTE